MPDNIEPDSLENTTSALSHLAFCALVALGIARQEGMAGIPYAENLFLIRWLATAQKQKRFPSILPGYWNGAVNTVRQVNYASIWNIYGVPVVAIWPPNQICFDSPTPLRH